MSFVSFHRISTSAPSPRSTRIPASAKGIPIKSVFKLILLSTMFTCVVFTELIVPATFRFPPTVKLLVMLTSSGRPIVTVVPSPVVGLTVTSFAVP